MASMSQHVTYKQWPNNYKQNIHRFKYTQHTHTIIYIYTEGIVMGGGFLIHRFFNHFLVKEHEKPAEDQKKQETIF